MKKYFGILSFLIALVMLFASCESVLSGKVADTIGSAETTVMTDTENTDKVTEPVCAEVDFIKEENDVYDDSGKIQYLVGDFIYPMVNVPSAEVKATIKKYFDDEKQTYYSESAKILDESRSMLADPDIADAWTTFGWYVEFKLEMSSEKYLSFTRYTSVYTGGVHPSNELKGVVFDLSDGSIVTLDAVENLVSTGKTEFVSTVKREILSQIKKSDICDVYFDGYEDNVEDVITDSTFYLSSDSIVFLANTYVLTPYAYGLQSYAIPYTVFSSLPDLGGINEFTRIYSFDMYEEDTDDVLGYLDGRQYSCPYTATESFTLDELTPQVSYIIPKHKGSSISIIALTADNDNNLTEGETVYRFDDTPSGFCLKLTGELAETLPLYRAVITYGCKTAKFDLTYDGRGEAPVRLIKVSK